MGYFLPKLMKKIVVLSLVLVTSLVLSGCSLSSGTQNNSINPTPAQEATIGSNVINIQNFAFNPGTLTVKKGSTVTWTNNDSATHQIKSDSFNSTGLANGQSFSFIFINTGSFDYSCAIHPSMTGKIIVE